MFSEQIVKKSKVAMPKAQTEKDKSGGGGPSQTSLAGECSMEEVKEELCILYGQLLPLPAGFLMAM